MYDEIKRRLTWVRLYQETQDAGLVCRRCGISYPTLWKSLRRYEELGEEGLASQSRRPRHSPAQKVFEEEEGWILALRRERKLGARRMQHELRREYQCHLSLETIHKVLFRHPTPPVRRPKRPVVPKRYSMALPGERAQIDTMKLAPGLYQYTFVDDCTRYLVAALYPRRTAVNTLAFLEEVLEEVPFPIQRLQTDNGTEFLAYKVRDFLLEQCIKHRPIPPRTPHLNGKVERAQKTVLDEFYATTTLDSSTLHEDLGEWLTDYNYRRVHGSLGMTPMQRFSEKAAQVPLTEEIAATFDRNTEANYVDVLWLKRHRQQADKK
jgi:transposase InsO family protein